MAELLQTPITQTQVVDKVQITKFIADYENLDMTVEYMTLLSDGTPYQRGQINIIDDVEMQKVYAETEALIAAGDNLQTASAKVAYARVLASV